MREVKYIADCGKRMLDELNDKNISITTMSRATGLSRTTIYEFVFNGRNTNSNALAKMCAYVGVSADYILGLSKKKKHNGTSIPVSVYEYDRFIGTFPSLKQASEFVGVRVGTASRWLNGRNKNKRYIFKEAE